MSAGMTSVVSAAKTSAVSADKRSAICQDIRLSLSTQGRPRSGHPCVYNAQGMSWQTADLLSADTTDVLAADTTDVLPADTTHVLPADKFGVGNPTFTNYFEGFGPRPGMLGVGNPFSEKMFQTHCVLHGLGAGRNLKADLPDQADPPEVVRSWQLAP